MLVTVQNPAGQRIVQPGRFDLLRHASALVIHLAVGEEEAVEPSLFRAEGEIEVFKVDEETFIESPQPSEQLLAHKKKRAHDVVDVPTGLMIPIRHEVGQPEGSREAFQADHSSHDHAGRQEPRARWRYLSSIVQQLNAHDPDPVVLWPFEELNWCDKGVTPEACIRVQE